MDSKGDRLEYPKAVLSLPFNDTGNTFFFKDDYEVACAGGVPDMQGSKVRHTVDDG